METEFEKRVPERTEMSQNCFVVNNILWKRITRHGGQHNEVITHKALAERLIN
jgi:hypothetical protein